MASTGFGVDLRCRLLNRTYDTDCCASDIGSPFSGGREGFGLDGREALCRIARYQG
jgi:hypothetical protein